MTGLDIDRLIAGWRGPLLAAVVALLAGLPVALILPPLDRDESRFAQATAQMLETGDYVNIQFQDDPRHKKPIGLHWLQAAGVALVSEAEDRDILAYRLPSLLAAALAAAALAFGAGPVFGQRASVLAGALLGTTFLLSSEAGIAKTDAALCAAVTVMMVALARLYLAARGQGPAVGRPTRLVFWLALAISVLIKGPIGPLVAGLTIGALTVADRDRGLIRSLGWRWGLLLVAAVVGPWAVAITVATDGAFWGASLGQDIAPKLASGQEGHFGWPGYHLILTPLTTFPAVLLLPAALMVGWGRRDEPAIRFALAWLVPAWLVFELAPTKLVHYPLPLFGALAWLMAAALAAPPGPLARRLGAGLAVVGALSLGGVVFYGLSEFGSGPAQVWASLTFGLALAAAAIGGLLLVRQAAVSGLVVAMVLGSLSHAALARLLADLDPLWISSRLERSLIEAGLDPRQGRLPGPVTLAGYAEPSSVFLLGTETELGDGTAAARAIAEGRPAVVEARQEAAFRAELGRLRQGVVTRGAVEGVNYSNGDAVSLTLYAPVPSDPTLIP